MKKLILLNGPPGCGKDAIANILTENHNGLNLKFAQPLRSAVCELLNIKDENLEENKLINPSIRTLMINIGENVVKPVLGKDWFAKLLVEKIKTDYVNHKLIVISDIGFIQEINIIYENLKDLYKIQLWKIYRSGKNFDIDSRDYLNHSDIKTCDISNNGDINTLKYLVSIKIKGKTPP